jgi:hypothetical protein
MPGGSKVCGTYAKDEIPAMIEVVFGTNNGTFVATPTELASSDDLIPARLPIAIADRGRSGVVMTTRTLRRSAPRTADYCRRSCPGVARR